MRQGRQDLAAIGLLLAWGIALLWPALGASLYSDDYTYVALVRQAEGPLTFFAHEFPFGGYLYRPLPMIVWWLVERLSGAPSVQYLCNSLLLGLCGAALYGLLRELQWSRRAASLVAAIFMALPGNVSAALWLSDRFDLVAMPLAVGALTCWLRYLRRGDGTALACSGLLLAGALLSKEWAYALPPMMVLVLALGSDAGRDALPHSTRRMVTSVTFAVMLALVGLVWRHHLGIPLRPPHGSGYLFPDMLSGFIKWWRWLPGALVFSGASSVSAAMSAVFDMAVLAMIAIAWRLSGRNPAVAVGVRPVIALGLGIVTLVPLIQAPHFVGTIVEFAQLDGGASGMFVERFYFFGSAGILLLVAGSTKALVGTTGQARISTMHRVVALGCMVILAACLARSNGVASIWPLKSGWSARIAKAAARAAVVGAPPAGLSCRMRFLGAGDGVFSFAAEAMVKVLANDPRVDRCIIDTESPPMFTLSHRDSLPWYRPIDVPGDRTKAVGFGHWVTMPGGRGVFDNVEVLRVYCYQQIADEFVEAGKGEASCQ